LNGPEDWILRYITFSIFLLYYIEYRRIQQHYTNCDWCEVRASMETF